MGLKDIQQIIDIPFVDHKLYIYSGIKGRESFNYQVKLDYPEWKDKKDSDGMNYNNHIFIENMSNKKVLLHEISHYLEWLYNELDCQKESEFKACLLTYIIRKIFQWE